MKKKFFGLVQVDEETPASPEATISFQEIQGEGPPPVAVEDIYRRAGLSNLGRSVHKVAEFKAALPDSLTTDVTRQTVLGVMKASELTQGEVVADAKSRLAALAAARDGSTADAANKIAANEAQIQDMESKIGALKSDNAAMKQAMDELVRIIDAEMREIEDIVKFISEGR